MSAAFLLAAALLSPAAPGGVQRVDPEPELGEVGQDVTVTVSSRAGDPLRGVAVQARSLEGDAVELGATDERGVVRFRPAAAGRYELRALVGPELVVVAPYEVRPVRRRWLWALVCVPVGLALLWVNLSRWRRQRP